MQKGKGFFRLVLAISILVFLIMSVYTFDELKTDYYNSKAYRNGVKGDLPKYSELLTEYNNLSEEERRQLMAAVGPKARSLLIEYEGLSNIERRQLITEFQSREKPSPFGKFIWQSMFIVAVYYVIPIWIIYGLTIFVVKGFMEKEKGR